MKTNFHNAFEHRILTALGCAHKNSNPDPKELRLKLVGMLWVLDGVFKTITDSIVTLSLDLEEPASIAQHLASTLRLELLDSLTDPETLTKLCKEADNDLVEMLRMGKPVSPFTTDRYQRLLRASSILTAGRIWIGT